MNKASIAGLVAVAAVAAAAAADRRSPTDAAADRIRADITFLASDSLQGREPGTPGFDIAAEYVAAQFTQLGLTPAGDPGSFYQRVPLVSYRLEDKGTATLRAPDGRSTSLEFGKDYLPSRTPVHRAASISAALVFVGYGIVAPERGIDDYAGLDVSGKVVVAMIGAPLDIPTEERAYYLSSVTKRVEAAKHGAIGFISLTTPDEDEEREFADAVRTWDTWGMTWQAMDGKPFDPAPGVPRLITLSAAGGEKLFAGAPAPFREVAQRADKSRGRNLPRFPLAMTLEATFHDETRPLESRNVAALLPGADPVLKDEVVVLSAHLDHIGVTRPVNGDRINNGALDNAAGVATTLEVARMLIAAPARPRRSVLFLTVTAEEKGLVGSEYFARNPTVPLERIVADVDLDMPIMKYDFTDVIAFGAERSTIGDAVRRAAGRMQVTLSRDPLPEEGLFVRSDHYRFVEAGVPAVFLMTGFANGGEKLFKDFLQRCYHQPCDDIAQGLDYNAGVKFARINYEITRELTDTAARPAWKPNDFFGEKFASTPSSR